MIPLQASATELADKVALLKALGFDRIPHSGRTLLAHLIGTYSILKSWGRKQYCCDAGLYHSIYGTPENGIQRVIDERERLVVRKQIGIHAEALVHSFCTLDRQWFYCFLDCTTSVETEYRERGAIDDPIRELCHLIAANWIDQAKYDASIDRQYDAKTVRAVERLLTPVAFRALYEAFPRTRFYE